MLHFLIDLSGPLHNDKTLTRKYNDIRKEELAQASKPQKRLLAPDALQRVALAVDVIIHELKINSKTSNAYGPDINETAKFYISI